MASEKYDAVPTVETSSHPPCSNWLRPWLQNQNASRSEKALDRGQTLRSNQPRTWNEVSNRHHICDRHSDLSDCFAPRTLHLRASRHKGFASSWCYQYGYVGKDQVCIWKVWEGEDKLQDCLRKGFQLCFMVSKAFDQRLSEGSCLGLVKVH